MVSRRSYVRTIRFLSGNNLFKGILRHVRHYHMVYGWLTILCEALLMFIVVSAFIVQAFRIPSRSMVPTLQVGDRIFVNKFVYWATRPKRGDIAVFRVPNAVLEKEPSKPNFVKRIVGLGDDELEIRSHPHLGYGRIYVNGELQPPGSKMREINYYYDFAPNQSRVRVDDPLFVVTDIINASALIERLRVSDDPLTRHLRASFSPKVREYIMGKNNSDTYDEMNPIAVAYQLIPDLNRVLKDPSLYNEERFAGVPITEETLKSARERRTGREVFEVNRLLLDEAYPEGLMRRFTRKVPHGEVYCFGDNSRDSYDSRMWGGMPEGNLIGQAFFRFWPPSRFGPLN